jgi:hypothetical protein
VSGKFKTKIQFNGCEYASADEMPVDVRAAYDRAVSETPVLHSGARLAAKLKATIIMNGAEFNNPGEMSVDDRQLYHEALEAMFPPGIAVFTPEARRIRRRQVLPVVIVLSVLVGAVYLWLRSFFG